MQQFTTANDILEFAIKNEEEAYDFYMELSSRSKNPGMAKAFADFAEEELVHKQKLLHIQEQGHFAHSGVRVEDLQLSEYIVDVEDTGELDYQSALILAMKKEKAAYKLYTDLAAQVKEPALRQLMLILAQEEAKHKLHFELEYDEQILREN
jgi:rubrerythrin